MPELTDTIKTDLAFFPTPRDMPEELTNIWQERLVDFLDSKKCGFISIDGFEGLLANNMLLSELGIDYLHLTLNQLLEFVGMNYVIKDIDKPFSNRPLDEILREEPLLTDFEFSNNNRDFRLKVYIKPFKFNGITIGQYIEVIEVDELSASKPETLLKITQNLLDELTQHSRSIAYTLSFDEDNVDQIGSIQMYMDPQLLSKQDWPMQNLNEFIGAFVSAEDQKHILASIQLAIKNFLESNESEVFERTIPLTIINIDGQPRDVMHKVKITREGKKIRIFGSGFDATELLSLSTFHSTLLSSAEQLTSTIEYQKKLDFFVEAIHETVAAETISIAVPSMEGDFDFPVRNQYSEHITNFRDIDEERRAASYRIIRRVMETKDEYLLISNYNEDPDGQFLVGRHNVNSYLGIPIIINGEVIGVINLSSSHVKAFTLEDIDKVLILARLLALAIDRNSFVDSLQKAVEKARGEADEALRIAIEAATLAEKRLDEQQKQNKLVLGLSAGSSHDLRTPISIIATAIGVLRRLLIEEIREKPKALDYFNKIDDYVRRSSQLIDEITQAYKALTEIFNKFEFINVKQELDSIFTNCALLPEQIAPPKEEPKALVDSGRKLETEEIVNAPKKKRVNVYFNFDTSSIPDNFQLFTNKSGFTRLMDNLLSNAIKYCRPDRDGNIACKAYLDDNYLHIEIEDNGRGIPDEFKEIAFNDFGRADNVQNVNGTGFGLIIVKTIVDVMGGNIDYTTVTTGENTGTIFKIMIPRRQEGQGFLLQSAQPPSKTMMEP